MNVTLEQFGLNTLSRETRLELLGLLWDSLGDEDFSPPEWHIRELEKRRAAADADPTGGIPWDEFKASWLSKK